MDNIRQFPGSISKIVDETGAGVKQIFSSMLTQNVMKGSLFYTILGNMGKSPYLRDLPLNFWAYTEFSVVHNNDPEQLFFRMESAFRNKLVPEFGIQGHREFLRIEADQYTREFTTNELPNDLLEHFTSYTCQFPSVNVERLKFCLAALACAIDYPGVKWGGTLVQDDKYIVVFAIPNEPRNGGGLSVARLIFDFLPFLLDRDAMQYFEERVE